MSNIRIFKNIIKATYFIIFGLIIKASFNSIVETSKNDILNITPTYLSIVEYDNSPISNIQVADNCPEISIYYLNEIIPNTSNSFSTGNIVNISNRIELICFYKKEQFTAISLSAKDIDELSVYYAVNTNHTIYMYLPTNETNMDQHVNSDFYGLLVHEITHSFQYNYYKQPITAVLPRWYMEGQAEFERFSQLGKLHEHIVLISNNSSITEYDQYLLEFYDYQNKIGKNDLYLLPFELTDGVSFSELVEKYGAQ